MDYLTKIYKEKCRKGFGRLSFKSYGNNFYRVVNDVFQSFQLQKSFSGSECTVHFVVAPLCAGDSIQKAYCGPNHIKMFENDYSWFQYDSNDEGSIYSCVDEMIGYIKKHLIPYFELSYNSKQAYLATCEFQQNHYKDGLFLADYYLFCMALKSKLYGNAIEHLIARRNHIENAYKINKENADGRLSPEYVERMQRKIKEIDFQVKMLLEDNLEYIQKYIEDNESKALLNLGIT